MPRPAGVEVRRVTPSGFGGGICGGTGVIDAPVASGSGPGSAEETGFAPGETECGSDSGVFNPAESGPSGLVSDGPSRDPSGPVASARPPLTASGESGDSVSGFSVTSTEALWPSGSLVSRSLPSLSAAGTAASSCCSGSLHGPGFSEGASEPGNSFGGIFSGPAGRGGFGGRRSGTGFAGTGGR